MITSAFTAQEVLFVEIDGVRYLVYMKAIFANNGWTHVEDDGKYYRQSTRVLTSEIGEKLTVEGLTDDPVIIAILRLRWINVFYGSFESPVTEIPVPTAADAEFINKHWDGTKESARNRRLFEIYFPRPIT